jgi:hypothetical protein
VPLRDKEARLKYRRDYYAAHRADQCAKILANRKLRKQRDKVKAITLRDWETYQSYRKFCRPSRAASGRSPGMVEKAPSDRQGSGCAPRLVHEKLGISGREDSQKRG